MLSVYLVFGCMAVLEIICLYLLWQHLRPPKDY
jgi:drug/metabolite transporter superfamily protein YnfA